MRKADLEIWDDAPKTMSRIDAPLTWLHDFSILLKEQKKLNKVLMSAGVILRRQYLTKGKRQIAK